MTTAEWDRIFGVTYTALGLFERFVVAQERSVAASERLAAATEAALAKAANEKDPLKMILAAGLASQRDAVSKAKGLDAKPIEGAITVTATWPGAASDQTETFEIMSDVAKIGKLSSAQVRIDHPDVSRMHAYLQRRSDGQVTISDLGSPAGMYYQGNRVDEKVLRNGDRVRLGRHVELFITWND